MMFFFVTNFFIIFCPSNFLLINLWIISRIYFFFLNNKLVLRTVPLRAARGCTVRKCRKHFLNADLKKE